MTLKPGSHYCLSLIGRHGQLKCVDLLLSKGSAVISDNSGVSTLELCAQVRGGNKKGGLLSYFNSTIYCLFIVVVVVVVVQNNYYECAVLILLKLPSSQIDLLLSLIFSNCIEERKMQALMEHISRSSAGLLVQVMTRLASNTSSAGMELLRSVCVMHQMTAPSLPQPLLSLMQSC